MPAPTRNGPCPCGSGTKYKKCCLPKDEAAKAASMPAPAPAHGPRIVTHRGRALMISGRGVPQHVLDDTVDFFEAKDRGEGPAAQMMRFVAPLLDEAGDDPRRRERALNLGTTFWNLATLNDDTRDRALDEIAGHLGDDVEKVASFRAMAADMVERHRTLFPEMHRR